MVGNNRNADLIRRLRNGLRPVLDMIRDRMEAADELERLYKQIDRLENEARKK